MAVSRERVARVVVLSLGLFILSQTWAQLAMEVHFPIALRVGPVTAVLFLR